MLLLVFHHCIKLFLNGSTDRIGEMVMERIKPLDEVAYIRFASIYHRFQDAGSFMREISKFLEEKP